MHREHIEHLVLNCNLLGLQVIKKRKLILYKMSDLVGNTN